MKDTYLISRIPSTSIYYLRKNKSGVSSPKEEPDFNTYGKSYTNRIKLIERVHRSIQQKRDSFLLDEKTLTFEDRHELEGVIRREMEKLK